jgi:signal transduction histidine kinase
VRGRLTLLVAAITSAVVLAFLLPLALLLRTLAEDRAIAAATSQSKSLLAVAAAALPQGDVRVRKAVAGLVGDKPEGRLSLYLDHDPDTDPAVTQARTSGHSLTLRGVTTVVYTPATISAGPSRSDRRTLVARAEISDAILHRGVSQAVAVVGGLGLGVLLVAVLVADRFFRRITVPLRELALAADRMRDGPIDDAVPEEGPKEVAALAAALNRLGARVRQLMASERDAVADLSHRLRTPVTALKLDTEFVQDRDVAERLRGHVVQLERTVDAIVYDAKRPSRSAQVSTSCDVGRVVAERVAFWSALAEDQDRPLRLALPDRPLRARLDAADLSDVVDVLIDNVFAHTDDGVPVEIWVVPRADGAVVLTVEDAGPGLPSVDVINRGKSSAGSTGLGLDIVRRAALGSGGSLELGRSRLGGALVRLVLGRAD